MDVKIIKHTLLILLICLTIVGCMLYVDVERKLTEALDSVVVEDSMQIYEKYFTSSGTQCSSTLINRWYGTNDSEKNVEQTIATELSNGGWQNRDNYWYLEYPDDKAEIRLTVISYVPSTIDASDSEYVIPHTIIEEMQKFERVYLFNGRYVPEFHCST